MRSGLAKLGWVLRLAFGKMLEGPGPWLRAARRGVFGLLPTPWQVRLIRWRYRLPEADPQGLEIQNSQVEQSGLVSVILPVFN